MNLLAGNLPAKYVCVNMIQLTIMSTEADQLSKQSVVASQLKPS